MNASSGFSVLSPEYLERFSRAEFKFRWLEALGLETAEWRRSGDLYAAFMLASFMDTDGHCYPSLAKLAKPMKKSPDTVRRSLRLLSDAGWLMIIPRSQNTNLYYARLPAQGLANLIKERDRPKEESHMKEWHRALWEILGPTCSAWQLASNVEHMEPDWARLEGRIYQLISRMGGPLADFKPLIRWMTEEASPGIESPVGFLLIRAGEFSDAYTHTKSKRKKR